MKTVFEVMIILPCRYDVEFWYSDNEVVPKLLEYSMDFQRAYANAAAVAYKLQQAGWSAEGSQCDLNFYPPKAYFTSREEAEAELRAAGVDPDEVCISETEIDDDWEDEDEDEGEESEEEEDNEEEDEGRFESLTQPKAHS